MDNITRQLHPTDLTKTLHDGLLDALKALTTYLVSCPTLFTPYVLPLTFATLSDPLIAIMPLASATGPVVAALPTALARFKIRQKYMGTWFAVLQAAGLGGVRGQLGSMMVILGAGAVFGPLGIEGIVSAILSTQSLCGPTLGLVLTRCTNSSSPSSALMAALGDGGITGTVGFVLNEVKALAVHRGINQGLISAEEVWRLFVESDFNSTNFERWMEWGYEKASKSCSKETMVPIEVDDFDEWEVIHTDTHPKPVQPVSTHYISSPASTQSISTTSLDGGITLTKEFFLLFFRL